MNYQDFLNTTLAQATIIAKDFFGKTTTAVKEGDTNQVLTEADLAIGKFILENLRKFYPAHNIIDEEAGVIDNGSDYTWVVDPIDGTSNFAVGLPMYGIMIGLLGGDIPIAGAVVLPFFDEVYVAEKGRGACRNGKPTHVSTEKQLLNTLLTYAIDGNHSHPQKTREECSLMAEIILNIRNLRISNSVYDQMLVARGVYGGWINNTSKIWDNVAPQIIIEEAGGLYTDIFGKPLDYSQPLTKATANFTQCAAPPILHRQIQKILTHHQHE